MLSARLTLLCRCQFTSGFGNCERGGLCAGKPRFVWVYVFRSLSEARDRRRFVRKPLLATAKFCQAGVELRTALRWGKNHAQKVCRPEADTAWVARRRPASAGSSFSNSLAQRAFDHQHRAGCFANYLFGNATEQEPGQTGSAMTAENDQVCR